MSNIYSEAIADAKKLKEIAEKNATNKVIESIAPQIRRLIEQEINDDIELDFGEDDSDVDDEDFENTPEDMSDMVDLSPAPEASFEIPQELVAPPVSAEPDDLEIEDDADEKNVTVNITVESRLDRRANELRKAAVDLVLQLKETKSKRNKKKILSELRKIKSLLVINNKADKKLGNEINEVLKESKMSNNNRRSTRQNKNAWWLFEGDDDVELDQEAETVEDQPEAEEVEENEDVDVAAIKAAVEELALAVNMEAVDDSDADDDDDEELDLGGDEEEDEDEELDLELEMHTPMREMQDEMEEADGSYEMDETADEEDGDEVLEISEAVLRREIARMKRTVSKRKRVSESTRARRARLARRRRLAEMGDPVAAMHTGADQVLDISKEDLINALAEELGDAHDEDLNVDGHTDAAAAADSFGGGAVSRGVVPESRRRRRSTRRPSVNERRNRKALLEARKEAAAAKRELQESNLFNAKLLYVNKLMQQHDLNSKQQRAIVEALDNAKTHREAKLLYTSLTESLRRRNGSKSSSSGKLSEGLVRGGSSSNPTKSAAPTKNGKGLDRWATLAGLKE